MTTWAQADPHLAATTAVTATTGVSRHREPVRPKLAGRQPPAKHPRSRPSLTWTTTRMAASRTRYLHLPGRTGVCVRALVPPNPRTQSLPSPSPTPTPYLSHHRLLCQRSPRHRQWSRTAISLNPRSSSRQSARSPRHRHAQEVSLRQEPHAQRLPLARDKRLLSRCGAECHSFPRHSRPRIHATCCSRSPPVSSVPML